MPQVASAQGASCGIIGNNLAVPFGQGGDFNEAQFTLALLTGQESVQPIIDLIKSSSSTVIVRLGAGKGTGPSDPVEYARMLNQIASEPGIKPFVATAGHNEPNCAEYIPVQDEINFVTVVAQQVTNPIVTLITGQIDHYCGNSDGVPGENAEAEAAYRSSYFTSLAGIGGIEGVALPFYITEGTPTAEKAVSYFNDFANLSGLPIYVTESGPFLPGSFDEFARAVPQLLASNNRIRAFLLFNAQGLNADGGFTYTKPFWNPLCREAFRTQCTNPDEVIRICNKESEASAFYLYKIDGMDPATLPNPPDRAVAIFGDLVNQGYQAHCTTPSFTVAGKRSDQWQRYIELAREGRVPSVVFNIPSTIEYNFGGSQIPLWRNTQETDTAYRTSIEDFFGRKEVAQKLADLSQREQEISSSMIYSKLNLEQQCQYQVHMLETIETMCNQLKDPSSCALYQPIPDFENITTQSLLSTYRSSGLTCEQIANSSALTTSQQEMANAIRNVPLYLDKAYRLAFLVVSAELKPDERPNAFFNFFTSLTTGFPMQQHEIRVIAFKIPDVATNKKRGEIYYDDPVQITRDLFQTEKQRADRIEKQEEEKIEFRNKPPEGLWINCQKPICNDDPLTKALVDIINRTEGSDISNACKVDAEDLKVDPASQLYSIGNPLLPTGTSTGDTTGGTDTTSTTDTSSTSEGSGALSTLALTFKTNFDLVKNLIINPLEQKETPQKASFSFLSNLDPSIENEGTTAEVTAYLVYPIGYDLEDIERTIAGYVFDLDQLAAFEARDDLNEYFEITGSTGVFQAESKSQPFSDPAQVCGTDPLTGLPLPCQSKTTVSLEAKDNNSGTRIHGGKLGFLMREMSKTAYQYRSGFWNFIDSCRSTEDFLLGRCSGQTANNGGSGSNTGGSGGGSGACDYQTTGNCSISNIQEVTGWDEAKAKIASAICWRESGGSATAENRSCNYGTDGIDNDGDGRTDSADSWLRQSRAGISFWSFDGGTLDYSVGLFQINVLAHCSEAGPDYSDLPDSEADAATTPPLHCSFSNTAARNACVGRLKDATGNILEMKRISQDGTNWGPWGGAPACGQ